VFRQAHVVSIAELAPHLKNLDTERKRTSTLYETRHETHQAMSYCNQFTHTKDAEVTAAVRATVNKYGVSAYNLGLIMNLAPESVDELKTLIPALDVRPPLPRLGLCNRAGCDGAVLTTDVLVRAQPAVDGSPFESDESIQKMLDELRVFRQVDFG